MSAALRRLRPILVRLARPPRLGGVPRRRTPPQIIVWRAGAPEVLSPEDPRARTLREAAERLLSAAQRGSGTP